MVGGVCGGVVMGSSPSGNSGGSASGTSLPASPQPQPQLSAIPMSASFPAVATGSTSSQTITLQNGGTASVTISSAGVTGTGFSTSGLALPISIAPGQTMEFNVVFMPSSAWNVTGSISLVSNSPNSPLTISTTASSGASTPLLSSSTNSLALGRVLLGTGSSLGATLTNTGNANVTIYIVLVTCEGFAISDATPTTTLPPKQTSLIP